MRTLTVVALSVLTLAGSLAGAEARGFRLRGSSFTLPLRTVTARDTVTRRAAAIATVGAIGPIDPTRPDTGIVTRSVTMLGAADETAPIPPMPPVPVAVKKPAEPWCPSGRIAGAGTGFCLIN